jgi:four helix bundle protein
MAFKFEQLKVWHKAVDLSNKIDTLARCFPAYERYNLSNQIKKAADSVVLNIAEGSTGQTNPEFKRFLRIALRSGIEVVACLYLALTRNYILLQEYELLYSEYEGLCKMIAGLMHSIQIRSNDP